MKRFIALLIMAAMVLSTAGAASAAMTIYEVVGTTNPDTSGNVMDLASSGVADTAIGATYPTATIFSGTEAIVTDTVKHTAGTWIVTFGGPVANSLTKELVDAGKIPATLNGYQKVINAWGTSTANVMVIFGPDRSATQAACNKFADDLRAGVPAAQLSGVGPLAHSFNIQEYGNSAMPTGTQIWRTGLPDNTGEFDTEGSVVSTDSEVLVTTKGTAITDGSKISVDLKQKTGQTQEITTKGDLKVGNDLSLSGTLTGTFSGQTAFGTMQDGIVTLKADQHSNQVDVMFKGLTIDATGIPVIHFNNFVVTSAGAITPPIIPLTPGAVGITELSGWFGPVNTGGNTFSNGVAGTTALAALTGPNSLRIDFSSNPPGPVTNVAIHSTISVQPLGQTISTTLTPGGAVTADVSGASYFVLHTKISPATAAVNNLIPPFTLSNGAFFTGTVTGDIAS